MIINPFWLGGLFRSHPVLGAGYHFWKALKSLFRAFR